MLRTLIFSPNYNTSHELYYVPNPVSDSVAKTVDVHVHRDIDLGQILYFIIVFCLYKMYKNKLSGVNTFVFIIF